MEIKNNSIMKNQSGAALVIALVMMTVLTLIGLASILTSVFEMKISGNKRGSTNAFYSSESGIQAVTTDIQNFDPPTKSYPYYPYSDTNNKTTPNPGAANVTITYNASMVGAPRGVGVSATNFGFAHFGITSKGRDLTDVSTNPSGCQLEERVVRLIPTQEGGY